MTDADMGPEFSQEAAMERIIELETELLEFQESSKDLEQALEDELHNLEAANEKLQSKYTRTLTQLTHANSKLAQLTQEVNRLSEENSHANQKYDAIVNELKSKLVSIEIANDNMETNDRVLENKLELSTQFNNELLEKLALVENDLEREKKKSLEAQLYLSNSQNEIRHLKDQQEELQKYLNQYDMHKSSRKQNSRRLPVRLLQFLFDGDEETGGGARGTSADKYIEKWSTSADSEADDDADEANFSILSMREILKAGPPLLRVSSMPKSNSLKKLHELTEKSEVLSEKVQSFKTALVPGGLKSPSTTHVSRRIASEPVTTSAATASTRKHRRQNSSSSLKIRARSSSRGSISPSPTIMNLAEISKGANYDMLIQDSPVKLKPKKLRTIEGSPAKPEMLEETLERRKSRKETILSSLKSMAI